VRWDEHNLRCMLSSFSMYQLFRVIMLRESLRPRIECTLVRGWDSALFGHHIQGSSKTLLYMGILRWRQNHYLAQIHQYPRGYTFHLSPSSARLGYLI